MDETGTPERPAMTETDEAADLATRAEAGDEAAEVALEAAGGPSASPDEAPEEPMNGLQREAPATPPEEATPAPSEEAALDGTDVDGHVAGETLEPKAEEPLPDEGVVDRSDAYVADAEGGPEPVEQEYPIPADPDVERVAAPEPVAEPAAEAETAVAEEAKVEPESDTEEGASPFDGPGDWYVVHTYAGYENKVKSNLQTRISSMQMEDKIFDVVIPMEDVMEIKGGKKQVVQRKVFPGYLLVKMIYDNDSWYVVRNTPGVTGFVASGTGTKPTPLSRREVEKILAVKEETREKPHFRLEFEEGDVVRISTGPFADFTGTIAEINVEQSKLKVLVNIFDRETPVELAFDQVAKA